jgi:hypothetical protein
VNTADKPYMYERMFPELCAQWDAHDGSCESLPWFWAGHSGGVSNPADLEHCHGCGVCFYREGVAWVNHATDDDEIRLCGCCARRAGHVVVVSSFGVGSP